MRVSGLSVDIRAEATPARLKPVQAGKDACATYSEEAAAACGVLFPKGHELVPRMLDTRPIRAEAESL